MITLNELCIKLSPALFNLAKHVESCQKILKLTTELREKLHRFCSKFYDMTQSNSYTDVEQVKAFVKQIKELASDSNLLFSSISQAKTPRYLSSDVVFWDGWVNISIQEQTLLEEILTHPNESKLQEIIDLLVAITMDPKIK
jgi:hypothetical protein